MSRPLSALAVAGALAATLAAPTTAVAGGSPYTGTPVSLPGHIKAENFDTGGEGVSYHDTTGGNSGGQYRSTDVDIEVASEGGYDVGWIAAGEWLNYSVNATAGGSYTVQLRVSAPWGSTLHVGFNGPSNVWKTVSVPATGGWQSWTTVSLPVTLGAGPQLLTLYFDTGAMNVENVDVASGASAGFSGGGASVTVVTWNIKIDSSTSHALSAIDYVMAMTPEPQVVVLDEAHQSFFNTYVNELQARSGKTWRGAFRTHCPPGAWNGSSCTGSEDEGVGVFTSLPVLDSGSTLLPGADQWHSARAATRLTVSVGGVATQVFGVHLAVNAPARATAMSALRAYAAGYSAPRLVAGDFNADKDQIEPAMSPDFVNSWSQVGVGNGYTAFTPSPTMKLDYWLEDSSGRAKPAWSVVVTTPGTFSDHYAVINSFSIH
jgi:endonuclease/exonuclease/phosphatase family metal-dependent hydrolase